MSEQRLQRSGFFALLGHPFVRGMKLCYLKWPSSTASVMDMPFSVTLQHCLMVRIDGRKNLSEPLLVLNVPQPIPRRSLSAGWTKRGRHYSEGAWATSTSKRRHVVVSCQEFFMKFVVPFKASQLDFQMLFDKGVCSQQRPWNARYHRNMVGLMPTWEHMLHNRLLEDYESQLNVTWLFDLSLICVEQHRKAHKCPMSFWDRGLGDQFRVGNLANCAAGTAWHLTAASSLHMSTEVGSFSESKPGTLNDCEWLDGKSRYCPLGCSTI